MTNTQVPTAVHDDLVAAVSDFTRHEVLPRAEALDARAPEALAAVWPRLTALDLDRALLAAELGGAGLDLGDFLCTLEELAVADAGVALAVLLHNAAVVALGPDEAAALPEGTRWTVASAPPAGEPSRAGVVFTREGESVYLTGRVTALAAMGAAGVVVTGREPEPAVVAVPAAAPGLTFSAYPRQLGLRAAPAADLAFERVRAVPGVGAAAVESRTRALVYGGVAAICGGIARRAHEIALAYAGTRVQGGVRLIEHGAIGDMLTAMTVRRHTGAISRLGDAADDPRTALAHKIAASDAAMATTTDAVQVLGGIGYMIDSGVEKLMRDAKYCQLYPEPNWLAGIELSRVTP